MNVKTPVAMSPAAARGRLIDQNTRSVEAPSTSALSSTSTGMSRKYPRIIQIT